MLFLSFVAVLWIWLLVNPAHRNLPMLDSTDAMPAAGLVPSVSIIVPARNEAAMLPTTIPSMCCQDDANLSVILVDDQSSDGSDQIIHQLKQRFTNLTCIQAGTRPLGWVGKNWAVQQGYLSAHGDWLLFTDADCVLHPAAVRQAVGLMQSQTLDCLSLLPRPIFGDLTEAIAVAGLASVLLLMFPMGWANDPHRPMALAAGGFILVRRAAYEKIGGHDAVRSHIVEDINLARKLKSSGAKIAVRLTHDLVTSRMYDGWFDLWEGLSKNAYAGMDFQPRKFWVGLVTVWLVGILPPLYFVAAVCRAINRHGTVAYTCVILSAITLLAMSLVHLRTIRWLRIPFWHCLMLPASAGFYSVICMNSFIQYHLHGGNVWKGRRYDRVPPVEPAGK